MILSVGLAFTRLDWTLEQIRRLERENLESTQPYLQQLGDIPHLRAAQRHSPWLVLTDVFRLYSSTLATAGPEEAVKAIHKCRAPFAGMSLVVADVSYYCFLIRFSESKLNFPLDFSAEAFMTTLTDSFGELEVT